MSMLEATAEETAFFQSKGEAVPESMKHLAEPVPQPEPEPEPEPQPEPQPEPEKAKAPEGGEPEPKADPEPTPEQKARLERTVPFAAVVEERAKRKAADERARLAEEALARIRDGGGKPPAPNEPVKQEGVDPLADIEQLKQWKAEREEQERQQGQAAQFQNVVIGLEQAYAKDNPDYQDAIAFLKDSRTAEMKVLGMNDQQIMQALAAEARQTAAYALQTDQNPAEVFHLLAKQRGFAPKAPGKQEEPAPNAGVVRLDRLQRGQQAGKTVSGGGGGAPAPTGPTLAAIADMEGAEFDNAWKNGTVKKLMGG